MPAKADVAPATFLRDSLPDSWRMDREFFQPSPVNDRWWDFFHDPLIQTLIDKAVENNWNLLAATKRIRMAENVWRQAKSAYFPGINLHAGWQREQNAGAITSPPSTSIASDYFSLGLTANWEIDVFGRVAAQSKASKAAYNASLADYDAVMVSLCANVAKAYINLRAAQRQLTIAKEHLDSQEKIYKMTEARFECGLASMLDVRQAKIVLLSTRATIPALKSTISSALNSLALLTGCYSEQLPEGLKVTSPLPTCPESIDVGIPMNLLRRRPDVVEAEMNLAQYAAQVGVAKKDFLPILSLTGSIATESHKASGLFGSHSLSYSVAPQLSWTVFDGMARNYRVAEAKARMEEAVDSYNLAVTTAVQEVRDAMSTYSSAIEETRLEELVAEECSKTLDLALDRYRQGLSDFTNVADAQMSWLQYQNSLVSSHAQALTSLVSLYTALGGGWEYNPDSPDKSK